MDGDNMDDGMMEKIIVEAYKEYKSIKQNQKEIPSVFKLKQKIEYNISAKAYDIIYGIDAGSVNNELIASVLARHHFIFYYEGAIYNPTQEVLINDI
jgi:hypothetical protein